MALDVPTTVNVLYGSNVLNREQHVELFLKVQKLIQKVKGLLMTDFYVLHLFTNFIIPFILFVFSLVG